MNTNVTFPLIDPYPYPKDQEALFVNEPWFLDESIIDYPLSKEPEPYQDNIRIYLPLDLNKKAILRRLDHVISRYKEATFENEMRFSIEVNRLIDQIAIYDRIWSVRQFEPDGKHCEKAKELVKEFVARLEEIPDIDSEMFPFQTIDKLTEEFLADNE